MYLLENYTWGKIKQGIQYKYFLPNPINLDWTWKDPKLNKLLEQASFQLGQLNSFSKLVPNIDLFIYLHVTKEAVVSSKIEGTQTHFDEAFLEKENINPERRDDWQEVQNYTKALNEAINSLKEIPISSRLILKTHKILMHGVRGEKKTPGEYRKTQNWIGGKTLATATFIPPHHEHLKDLISDLEHFIHNDAHEIPMLIKAAILHYQFETIHPFLDGNGRIGRLLIPLFLMEKGVLKKPLLYLSSYFEKNKNLYYDSLTKVRTQNAMMQWIQYFLIGIAETSEKAAITLSKVLALKSETEQMIQKDFGRRIKVGLILYNYLLQNITLTIKEIQEVCDLSPKAANELAALFEKKGILKERTGFSRNRIFIYDSCLRLYND